MLAELITTVTCGVQRNLTMRTHGWVPGACSVINADKVGEMRKSKVFRAAAYFRSFQQPGMPYIIQSLCHTSPFMGMYSLCAWNHKYLLFPMPNEYYIFSNSRMMLKKCLLKVPRSLHVHTCPHIALEWTCNRVKKICKLEGNCEGGKNYVTC